jgi:hypothetical protein
MKSDFDTHQDSRWLGLSANDPVVQEYLAQCPPAAQTLTAAGLMKNPGSGAIEAGAQVFSANAKAFSSPLSSPLIDTGNKLGATPPAPTLGLGTPPPLLTDNGATPNTYTGTPGSLGPGQLGALIGSNFMGTSGGNLTGLPSGTKLAALTPQPRLEDGNKIDPTDKRYTFNRTQKIDQAQTQELKRLTQAFSGAPDPDSAPADPRRFGATDNSH